MALTTAAIPAMLKARTRPAYQVYALALVPRSAIDTARTRSISVEAENWPSLKIQATSATNVAMLMIHSAQPIAGERTQRQTCCDANLKMVATGITCGWSIKRPANVARRLLVGSSFVFC